MTNTNYIAGYRKQPQNPWPRIWAIIAILVMIFLWTIMNTPSPHTPKQPKIPPKSTKIIAAQTTVEVITKTPASTKVTVVAAAITNALYSGAMPSFNITRFSARTQRIYYYTKIQSEKVPAIVYHVWYSPNGEVASVIPLNLSGANSSTYSYHTVDAEETGTWKVLTRDQNQNVLDSAAFVVAR
jgi:hypothetical protein